MKLQVWIQGYEFESIQFCPPLVLKHKSGKSKANRLKQVKDCVQSLLTMHASEDMPAAELQDLLAVAGYTSIPFILCRIIDKDKQLVDTGNSEGAE